MSEPSPAVRTRITLAIHALGGQGGGVLADWIRDTAASCGYIVQTTSVPGVAQRTGSTVYYVEMIPQPPPGANARPPVLALMPSPGDVDIVLALELMEGGRAILRGFVTPDRTTLVTSTHRVYAISEKVVSGDGIRSSERIVETARSRAKRFVGFDMEAAANQSGSVISSVMLGALAGSGALPFPAEAYVEAIRRGGKAVSANLQGFETGRALAEGAAPATEAPHEPPAPTTAAGRRLASRVDSSLPREVRELALEGVRRLMDYQGERYAGLYLDRLQRLAALDRSLSHAVTARAARWLALWMAYEDTIRVADLKTRASRAARVAAEVRLSDGQLLQVTEYMHPRLQEVCDVLPAPLGRAILRSRGLRGTLERLFRRGRHVEVTTVRWFLALSLIGALRPIRPLSLRYAEEQQRIEDWLATLEEVLARDLDLAAELAEAPRLLKGYSDTFERGLERYRSIMAEGLRRLGDPDAARAVRQAREAALADDCEQAEAALRPVAPHARRQASG